MFQEKEIEAYKQIKAPVELKNRIQISIEQQRKKIRKQQIRFIAVAATFVILISEMLLKNIKQITLILLVFIVNTM